MYRAHIGWTSSKLITRIISLGLRSSEPQHRQVSPNGTPLKFGWNRDGVALLRKHAISLKRGKIGTRLLLMTNSKSIRAFDWCQNQRPWMTLKGHYTPCFKTRLSEPITEICMKIYPYYQRRRCSPTTLDSGNIRFMRIFAGIPAKGASCNSGVIENMFFGLSEATYSAP